VNHADEKAKDEAASGAHRRRSRRIRLEAIVHYQIEGSEFINLSSNLSSDGIFIKNFSPPPVGTRLKIKVQLPEEHQSVPLLLFGNVVRVVEGVGVEERGMGVEFTSVQAESLETIRYFVNEVYEIAHLDRSDVTRNEETGVFDYQPGPEDVLRLHAEDLQRGASSRGAPDPSSQRLLRSILLVLVGILLGGGFVFLFFLLR
jgi:uncharacterized protein (TIGR02266 family)